jgi:hypothetical protein
VKRCGVSYANSARCGCVLSRVSGRTIEPPANGPWLTWPTSDSQINAARHRTLARPLQTKPCWGFERPALIHNAAKRLYSAWPRCALHHKQTVPTANCGDRKPVKLFHREKTAKPFHRADEAIFMVRRRRRETNGWH